MMTNRILRAFLPTLLLLAGAQQTGFAYVSDRVTYLPVDYGTLLPPAVGASYVDPAFGTSIKRMSNALVWPDAADTGTLVLVTNEYATMSPFNADTSRIVVQHRSYFSLYDGAGNYLHDLPLEIAASSEPRWSRTDPNALYYHDVYGNQLKRYDVGTGQSSVVRTFAEYSTISGLGESDTAFDGDRLVLVGDSRYIFVYDIATDAKGPALDTGGPSLVDSVQITPDDNVIVKWYQAGAGRSHGVELYDNTMSFLRQLTTVTGHLDVTRDVNGDEVMVWMNAADSLAICPNGVVKVRLADATQTCLLSLDWSLAAHVSAPDGSGWILVSTYSPSDPGPVSGWKAYTNEILQVKLDGSEVRRLAQHRSRPFNSYYYTPRASVSRDGSKMIYTSNFGLPGILGAPAEYADAYLVDLGGTVPTSAGSANSVATRLEQDAATYACPSGASWYSNNYPLHSGGSAALAITAGCDATLAFTGTAVSWIGYQDQWSGIARVFIDDGLATAVDTYAAYAKPQSVLFSTNGLAPGAHTLRIEVTGTAGGPAAGAWIWVDAFDVLNRLEQDDPAASYACAAWSTDTSPLYSGGSAARTATQGCRVTLAFTGTAVSWIGYQDQASGIANVYLDGVFRAEVDTYAPAAVAQARSFTLSSLAAGPHTLTIEVTGRRSPLSAGASVLVDAFEVHP